MIERQLKLIELLENNSILLFGPRGTGKSLLASTILKNFNSETLTFDFLLSDNFSKYLINPSLLRNEIEYKLKDVPKLLVLIDEVQKIPSILDEVHFLIEKFKNKISFILTGSSARKLKKVGANLLAGRAFVFHLYPFSYFELKNDFSLNEVLKWGALPIVYDKNNILEKELVLKSYADTYLREEIKQESLVRSVESFSLFLDLACQLNAEPINYSKISKQCTVSANTIKEYYQILFDTMLAFPLCAWKKSIKKQIVQAHKVYFFDIGVINSIRKELSFEISEHSFRTGKLFETFIILEFIKLNSYFQKNYGLYYWRTNTGVEVDLILQKSINTPPVAIEIKLSAFVVKEDLKHLYKFKEEEPSAELFCISNVVNAYEIDGVKILPYCEALEWFINY